VRVLLKGGLGNQLFQFCYLHFLYNSTQKKVGMIKDPNSRVDRPFNLERLLHSCNHVESAVRVTRKSHFLTLKTKLANVRFIKGLIYRYQELKVVHEKHEYIFSEKIPKNRNKSVFVGYFQHWSYVESVWEIIGPEILASLNKQIILKYSLNDYLVVHVRRGDFILQSEQLGTLKSLYYDKALQLVLTTLNLPRISLFVITDDPQEAKQIFKENSDVRIIGPTELDEWGCLSLMSGAKAVITANSTLSWWGGYLSFKNGGTTVIPYPWFAGWSEKVGSAFAYPGVLQVDSRYSQ
jgi:hypothetical protein